MSRRSLLRLLGAAGLGLAVGRPNPPPCETVRQDRELFRVSMTRLAMGTFVTVIALDPSRQRAQDAAGAAHEEVGRLERLLGRFHPAAPVSMLNREGQLSDSPPELDVVLAAALNHHRRSGGAFDITVQPVVDLFRERHAAGELPCDAALGQALELVDGAGVLAGPGRVRLDRPGMGITLDGIAKGYVVDQASDLLARRGVDNHLVNAGGDIRARGHARRGRPWRVAVQDPAGGADCPAVIRLSGGAVATTGNYEIYYDRERLYHHITDPATGLSPRASASVSVLAGSAMDADALSTGVFVMDPDRGARYIDSLPACECLVLDRHKGWHLSRGWPGAVL